METRAPYTVTPAAPALDPAILAEAENGFRQPTPDELRQVIKMCYRPDGSTFTGADVGALTGTIGRSVRRWTAPVGDDGHRDIPYAAWRLILIAAGLVEPPSASKPHK